MSLLFAVLMSLASMTIHADHYEDGSSLLVVEWTAPSCPDINDEPCYLAIVTDAETGDIRLFEGP